jgi:predicted phosphodiesterase
MRSGRIVILSDTHLGRERCAALSAEALRPLWRDAAHLVVNGDLAEIHHRDHWTRAAQETLRIFDLCEEDGVALTVLSGNHDPYISDIRHLILRNGQIFITHGDVLHPAVAPWSPAAGRIRIAHKKAISALEGEQRSHLEAILSASQFASHAEWDQLEEEASHSSVLGMLVRPWAIAQVFHYWWRFPRMAANFVAAHEPRARFAIMGHTHRPGIWGLNGLTIINTGSFGFPGTPRAVTIEDDELCVWRVLCDGKEYRYDTETAARFHLPEAPEISADRSELENETDSEATPLAESA